MKILIFSNVYFPNRIGGAEVSTQILAEGLVRNGHHVTVITLHEKRSGYTKQTINNVNVYYLSASYLYNPFLNNHKYFKLLKPIWHLLDSFGIFKESLIRKILRREKPDVVHTNNIAGFSVGVWRLIHNEAIPLAHTFRDYYLLCARTTKFKNSKNCDKICSSCRPFHRLKLKFIHHVDHQVFISNYLKNEYNKFGITQSQSTVIYNSISAYSLPDFKLKPFCGRLKIGYLGRYTEEKGIQTFIEVALKFHQSFDFYLAGSDNADIEIPKFIKHRGYVCSDEYFKLIDILLVPINWNEPFGRIVIEAFSHGIPVIASRMGAMKELIQHRHNGFLYDPKDPDGLTEIMENSLNKEHLEKMRLNCLSEAAKFQADSYVEQYENLYSKLIHDNSN